MPDPVIPVRGTFGASIHAMSGAVALRLNGELDLDATEVLERAIDSAVEAAEPGEGLILDLDRLTFIDAAGVVSIMEGVGAASRQGHRVAIVGAGPAVHRVFELAGMHSRLGPEADLVDAD